MFQAASMVEKRSRWREPEYREYVREQGAFVSSLVEEGCFPDAAEVLRRALAKMNKRTTRGLPRPDITEPGKLGL